MLYRKGDIVQEKEVVNTDVAKMDSVKFRDTDESEKEDNKKKKIGG